MYDRTTEDYRYHLTDQLDDGLGGSIWVRDSHTGQTVSVGYSTVIAGVPRDREEAMDVAVRKLKERETEVGP